MKASLLILTFIVFYSFSSFAQPGKYIVQVAAFDQHVNLDYFTGVEGVYEEVDHNRIHHYYIAGFANEAEARSARDAAIRAGHKNAYVIDIQAIRDKCSQTCGGPSVTSVFFDFDKYNIRPSAQRKLNDLVDVLKYYPDYSVELRAHTDWMGSDGYNQELSQNRAASARNYVIAKGIDPSRVKTKFYGEQSPIARNALKDGSDTEEGRQLNRRVEVWVVDGSGNVVNSVVEQIYVPSHLKL